MFLLVHAFSRFARLLVTIVFILFTGQITLFCQTGTFSLEPYSINFDTDDGLPSSECHHIIQDSLGYIWIATDNGLSRFDGYEFKNYGAGEGLQDNVIFYLQEDREGKIWMLSMSGRLYYYDKVNDGIEEYQFNKLITKYREQFEWAGPFYIDSLERVHIGLKNFGVLSIDSVGQSRLLQTEEMGGMGIKSIEDFLVYSVINCPEKRMDECAKYSNQFKWKFFYDADSTKTLITARSNDFKNTLGRIYAPNNFVKRVSPDFIFGQWIYESYHISDDLHYVQGNYYYRVSNGKAIIELKDGMILVGQSIPGGVYLFPSRQVLEKGNHSKKILENQEISSMMEDVDGGIWVSTTKKGVFYFPSLKNVILKELDREFQRNVTSFTFFNGGDLVAGYENGTVNILDMNQQTISSLSAYKGIGPVRTIFYDELEDNIWIASGNLSYINANGVTDMYYTVSKGEAKDKKLFPIAKSFNLTPDRGNIWSWNGKHFKIDLRKKQILFDGTKNSRSKSRTIQTVFEDIDGNIWVGKTDGLYLFQNQEMIPQKQYPAFQSRIEAVSQFKDSTLIIATKGSGILLWQNDSIHQIKKENGLTSDIIENIYIDSLERLWVGTSEGLNSVIFNQNRYEYAIKQYTVKNGLPSNEINQVRFRDDKIWIATAKGLLNLSLQNGNIVSNPPIIQNIYVNGVESLSIDNLRYNQNSIQFKFITLDYPQLGDINYRYRFKYNLGDWKYTKNRQLDFLSLSPNTYSLEIQSQNRDGIWSESSIVNFTIHPPFWKTWWFMIISILLLAGSIYGFIYIRIQRIQKEAKLVKQIAEAEQFALRAQMNPHFIFNCLASIQGLISIGDKHKAIRYLAKFSKLIRMTLQSSGKEMITIQDEVNMVRHYLELEKLRHEKRFDYQIEVSEAINADELEIPPLMVQPFIENAIIHAFKGMNKLGMIKVNYQQQGKHLIATVEDNGIGLIASAKGKRKRGIHQSMGMDIVKKRLALNEELNMSALEIFELKTDNNEVHGTKVRLDFGAIIEEEGAS